MEDIDSLRFALSLHEFSLVKLQPHFPGYPIFCFIAKILYSFTGNMGISFALIGGLSVFIIIYYSLKICKTDPISYTGLFITVLLFINPLIWLMGNRYMPDLMGLGILIMSLYYLLFDNEQNKYLNYGFFIAGILLGIRVSYFPLLIIPIIYIISIHQNKIKCIYSFIIGIGIWFVPLVYITGFEQLIYLASKQTIGHFTDFGGTVITEFNWYERITYFIKSLWADGLGGFWIGRAWPTIITSICIFFLLYQYRYLKNWSWFSKKHYQLILFSIIIYIAWVLLFQNVIYKSRHILPVLLFAILFIVQGYRYYRVYQPFIANMIAIVLFLSLIQITYTLTAQHKIPNAISQLTTYVEELDDSLDVISIPLINYYLKTHGVNKNFVDINIHKEHNLNQITNIRKNNIVIGDFRKLFEENYNIIPDTIFYHNPYVNRMWSKIDTYHLIK